MQTLSPVLEQLRAAKLAVTVKPNGILSVSPSTNLTDDLRDVIRTHKAALIEWALSTPTEATATSTATTTPPGPSAGTTAAPPVPPAPQAPTKPPAKANQVKHVHQSWKPLAMAYHVHHMRCPTCIAAGRGYGQRCGVGVSLWTGYQAATNDN